MGDQVQVRQRDELTLFRLDLGVEQPALRHAPEIPIHPDEVTRAEVANNAQHHSAQGIPEDGGGRECDRRAQQDTQQAQQLAAQGIPDGEDHDHDQNAHEGEADHDHLVAEAVALRQSLPSLQQAIRDVQHNDDAGHGHGRGNERERGAQQLGEDFHWCLGSESVECPIELLRRRLGLFSREQVCQPRTCRDHLRLQRRIRVLPQLLQPARRRVAETRMNET